MKQEQKGSVASNLYSLAEAYVYYGSAHPYAIYADGGMVGFLMLGYREDDEAYNIWRFMIDEKFQNKGYGKSAMIRALELIKMDPSAKTVLLSAEPENQTAINLYEKFGFRLTGEIDEGEAVMKLTIDL